MGRERSHGCLDVIAQRRAADAVPDLSIAVRRAGEHGTGAIPVPGDVLGLPNDVEALAQTHDRRALEDRRACSPIVDAACTVVGGVADGELAEHRCHLRRPGRAQPGGGTIAQRTRRSVVVVEFA